MSEEGTPEKQNDVQSMILAAMKDLKVELKQEMLEALRKDPSGASLVAVEGKKTKATKEPKPNRTPGKFDPSKPRAVWRKVRCAAKSDRGMVPAPGETSASIPLDAGPGICGAVYNRVMSNHGNLHGIDIKATKDGCPSCGGHEWEDLVKFTHHSPDSPNVTVHKTRRGI